MLPSSAGSEKIPGWFFSTGFFWLVQVGKIVSLNRSRLMSSTRNPHIAGRPSQVWPSLAALDRTHWYGSVRDIDLPYSPFCYRSPLVYSIFIDLLSYSTLHLSTVIFLLSGMLISSLLLTGALTIFQKGAEGPPGHVNPYQVLFNV